MTPGRRVWLRFRQHRLGYWSLIVFVVAFAISLAGPLWSNDKPLVVRYEGHLYFPLVKTYAETTFGGDFPTPADYLDPYIRDRFSAPGNFAIYPPNHYYYDTLNYFSKGSNPAPPSRETGSAPTTAAAMCSRGCLRLSRVGAVRARADADRHAYSALLAGAVQGYFGGRIDITGSV